MYMSNAEFFGALLAMQSGDVAYWTTTNHTGIIDAICYRDNDGFLAVYLENNFESLGRQWTAKEFTARQKGDYGAADSKITHFELLVQDNERIELLIDHISKVCDTD
jgi:hypothetical protein